MRDVGKNSEYWNLASRRALSGLVELSEESEEHDFFTDQAILRFTSSDRRYGSIQNHDISELLEPYIHKRLVKVVNLHASEIRDGVNTLYNQGAIGYRANLKSKKIRDVIGNID